MELPARFITRTITLHPIKIYRSAFVFSSYSNSKGSEADGFLKVIYGVFYNQLLYINATVNYRTELVWNWYC